MVEPHLLIPDRGMAGEVAGLVSQADQLVNVVASQLDTVDRVGPQEVNKMVDDGVEQKSIKK